KKLDPLEEPKKVVEKLEQWMPLICEYEVDPIFSIVVTHVGSAVYAQPTSQEMSLLQATSDPLVYKINADKTIEFVKDENGVVSRLIFHNTGNQKVAYKKIKR
ncbi:MAG: hypothetical protein JWQ38_789, partial [Flavipsychrobacter sp.]|nr:hypothetical protein [Flavipsychrobacter sp.]